MSERFSTSAPIYLQIVDRICRRIVRGELAPGARLPSVRESAIEHGVSPNTVQRAYEELERRHITDVRRGQGTFVTEAVERIEALRNDLRQEAIAAFVQDMGALGWSRGQILDGVRRHLAAVEPGAPTGDLASGSLQKGDAT